MGRNSKSLVKIHMENDETNETVLALWAANKTGTEIAKALGTTRSAILGRIARLRAKGLVAYRITPLAKMSAAQRKTAKKQQMAKKAEQAVIRNIVKKVERMKMLGEIWPRIVQPPLGRPLNIMELQYNSCRYIEGAIKGEDTRYCGEPIMRRSCCAQHYSRCYVLSKPRAEAQSA